MPVSLQDPISSSYANGVTTVFPYQFLLPSVDGMAVEVDGTRVTTGFSVSGVGNPAGGNVTFTVPPAAGALVVRYRDLPAKRDFDWTEGGDLLAAIHDANDDYAIMLIQQLFERVRRTPAVPRGSTLPASALTFPAPGAGGSIRWNVAGTALETYSADVLGGNFLQSGAGAVARTWTAKAGELVSITDFDARPNGVSDCLLALQRAQAAMPAGGGQRVYIPPGLWDCSDSFNLTRFMHLVGAGSSEFTDRGSVLRFAADKSGIFVNRHNTLGYATVGGGTYEGAYHSILEDFSIKSLGYVANPSADGVVARARVQMRNLTVQGFKRNGLRMLTTLGSGGATEGNANVSRVMECRFLQNGGDGCYIAGNDSNVILIDHCDSSGNGGWGFNDESAFGNKYLCCHVDTNTGGPYRTTGASAPHTIDTCYSEVSGVASSFTGPTTVIGGLHNAGFNADVTYIVGGVAAESRFAGPLRTRTSVRFNKQVDAALYPCTFGNTDPPPGVQDLEQVFSGLAVWGSGPAGTFTAFGWNCYFFGGFWKSRTNGPATLIKMNNAAGTVTISTAPAPGGADQNLTFTDQMVIAGTGVTIPALAGVGSRHVLASATGVLSAP